MSAYPFAIFFSAPYTEALFLLASVAVFHHYRVREWAPAALWGLLVGLTRPNGCFLSIVLACLTIEHVWRASPAGFREYPLGRALITAAAPGVGMLAYSAYVRHLTGEWFGWVHAQGAWGRSFQGLASLAKDFEWIEQETLLQVFVGVPFATLNAFGLLFALAMLWPVFRRIGLAAGVFVVVNVVPPFLAGGVLSMGRFTSTLFPIFLALAAILPRSATVSCVTAFAVGQGLVAAIFFTWREIF